MKILFVVVWLISTLTCCTNTGLEFDSYSNTKSSLVNEIRNKFFLEMRKEKNLYPSGTGGQMMDQIKMIYCAFDHFGEMDIEESRKLMVKAGNLLLKKINEEERIHPYLDQYPFKPENIEICVFLKESNGSELGFDKLHVISLINGLLSYEIRASPQDIKQSPHGFLKTIYEETFDEACAKVASAVENAEHQDENRI